MVEIWKDVKSYEGYYQVSNLGRVKSTTRIVESSTKEGLLKTRTIKEVILSNKPNTIGYVQVGLCRNGAVIRALVHRLVAEAFIENNGKPCVNHLDGIKNNNLYTNLEWCTYQENNIHALDTGLNNNFSYKSVKSKLTKNDLEDIMDKYHNKKMSPMEISTEYNISESGIAYLVTHKTHRRYKIKFESIKTERTEYPIFKEETWIKIDGYSIYEVSSLGNIRVLDRTVNVLKQGHNIQRKLKCRLLNKNIVNGHFICSLNNGSVSESKMVSQLVAKAFVPNIFNKNKVKHINGNKLDNTYTNLEWISWSECRRPDEAFLDAIEATGVNVDFKLK